MSSLNLADGIFKNFYALSAYNSLPASGDWEHSDRVLDIKYYQDNNHDLINARWPGHLLNDPN